MIETSGDSELELVVDALLQMDPEGERFARVYRETFDQLYDGQRTGRYKWDDLYKTEKTHFGTLIEINLQREFDFADGDSLDYRIAGIEVDCKYSYQLGGWMLPPESWGKLVMVSTANDQTSSWSLGVVRVTEENRRMTGHNRDGKTGLNVRGRAAVTWLFRDTEFAPNVLLQLSSESIDAIFSAKRGQARLNELFRQAQEMRIHRNAVATVAQQYDYMKRVRSNGGSRSRLREEGFLIVGGDYKVQRELAEAFGVLVPRRGELVSFRVRPTDASDVLAVAIDGAWWRKAERGEILSVPAPELPRSTTS